MKKTKYEKMWEETEIKPESYEEFGKYTEEIYKKAQKEMNKLWSDKFDKFACIKNDKWYLEWKEELKRDDLLCIGYEEKCTHMYSRSMNQVYPRKCTLCGEVEK